MTNPQNSYPASLRLRTSRDFEYLRSGSSRIFTSTLKLYYKPRQNCSQASRLGLSVSKRYGNACFRNHFKRVVREFFRSSKMRSMGQDFLVVLRKNLDSDRQRASRQLQAELSQLEKKIRCNHQ